MLGPRLVGERIRLEPPEVEDLDVFRSWFVEPEVTRYLLTRFSFSAEQEQEWYRRVSTDDHVVTWKVVAGDATIGTTALVSIDWMNRQGHSGTIIGDRTQWGRGYASEFVALRTRYAFDELGLERLETESFAENLPMHRALQKSGYREFGRRRRAVFRGGAWHDVLLFELLHDEWEAAR